ncbi:hypothetical protein [Candidatus Nitrosocosmicus sp. R]
MSSKHETESPDIIEEIIPGKNNDYNAKPINQNNNNNQQSFIENYNEQESAQAVIEASGESEKSMKRNVDEAVDQIPRYAQTIVETQEQTAQATRKIAENYLEFQKQTINSFQSLFIPYFQNIQNQLWNNEEFFKNISVMYYKLVNNYAESTITFSRIWNYTIFTNPGLYKNVTNKASK